MSSIVSAASTAAGGALAQLTAGDGESLKAAAYTSILLTSAFMHFWIVPRARQIRRIQIDLVMMRHRPPRWLAYVWSAIGERFQWRHDDADYEEVEVPVADYDDSDHDDDEAAVW